MFNFSTKFSGVILFSLIFLWSMIWVGDIANAQLDDVVWWGWWWTACTWPAWWCTSSTAYSSWSNGVCECIEVAVWSEWCWKPCDKLPQFYIDINGNVQPMNRYDIWWEPICHRSGTYDYSCISSLWETNTTVVECVWVAEVCECETPGPAGDAIECDDWPPPTASWWWAIYPWTLQYSTCSPTKKCDWICNDWRSRVNDDPAYCAENSCDTSSLPSFSQECDGMPLPNAPNMTPTLYDNDNCPDWSEPFHDCSYECMDWYSRVWNNTTWYTCEPNSCEYEPANAKQCDVVMLPTSVWYTTRVYDREDLCPAPWTTLYDRPCVFHCEEWFSDEPHPTIAWQEVCLPNSCDTTNLPWNTQACNNWLPLPTEHLQSISIRDNGSCPDWSNQSHDCNFECINDHSKVVDPNTWVITCEPNSCEYYPSDADPCPNSPPPDDIDDPTTLYDNWSTSCQTTTVPCRFECKEWFSPVPDPSNPWQSICEANSCDTSTLPLNVQVCNNWEPAPNDVLDESHVVTNWACPDWTSQSDECYFECQDWYSRQWNTTTGYTCELNTCEPWPANSEACNNGLPEPSSPNSTAHVVDQVTNCPDWTSQWHECYYNCIDWYSRVSDGNWWYTCEENTCLLPPPANSTECPNMPDPNSPNTPISIYNSCPDWSSLLHDCTWICDSGYIKSWNECVTYCWNWITESQNWQWSWWPANDWAEACDDWANGIITDWCSDDCQVTWCTDPLACNYDDTATLDDWSCDLWLECVDYDWSQWWNTCDFYQLCDETSCPSAPDDMCDGEDNDCDPDTVDWSGDPDFWQPCDWDGEECMEKSCIEDPAGTFEMWCEYETEDCIYEIFVEDSVSGSITSFNQFTYRYWASWDYIGEVELRKKVIKTCNWQSPETIIDSIFRDYYVAYLWYRTEAIGPTNWDDWVLVDTIDLIINGSSTTVSIPTTISWTDIYDYEQNLVNYINSTYPGINLTINWSWIYDSVDQWNVSWLDWNWQTILTDWTTRSHTISPGFHPPISQSHSISGCWQIKYSMQTDSSGITLQNYTTNSYEISPWSVAVFTNFVSDHSPTITCSWPPIVPDCAWECWWSATLDLCLECNWDNSTCADCAWTPNWSAVIVCGQCNGSEISCTDYATCGSYSTCGPCDTNIPTDVCDWIDNNCDGQIDENWVCDCIWTAPVDASLCPAEPDPAWETNTLYWACSSTVACDWTCNTWYTFDNWVCVLNSCDGTAPDPYSSQCTGPTDPSTPNEIGSLVSSCDDTIACEWICDADYTLVWWSCVLNSCDGAAPDPYSSQCVGPTDPSAPNEIGSLVSSCDDTIACEWICDAWYELIWWACVAYSCDTTAPDTHATQCGWPIDPTEPNQDNVMVWSCDDAIACDWTCDIWYTLQWWVCVENTCNTSMPDGNATQCGWPIDPTEPNQDNVMLATCDDTVACDWTCDTWYTLQWWECVLDTCNIIAPDANATQCGWPLDPTEPDQDNVMVTACDDTIACDWICNSWYTLQWWVCVENTCNTTAPDTNATQCGWPIDPIEPNQDNVMVATCDDTIACDWTCNSWFSLVWWVCVESSCNTTAPDINAVQCGWPIDPTEANQDNVMLEICDDTVACDWICDSWYTLQWWVCVENSCDQPTININATECLDWIDPTEPNQEYVLWSECTTTACDWICNEWFTLQWWVCVEDGCNGSSPNWAVACNDLPDPEWTETNVLLQACDITIACDWICDSNHTYNIDTWECDLNYCDETLPDDNAVLCEAPLDPIEPNQSWSLLESCDDEIACDWECNSTHTFVWWVCVPNDCSSSPPLALDWTPVENATVCTDALPLAEEPNQETVLAVVACSELVACDRYCSSWFVYDAATLDCIPEDLCGNWVIDLLGADGEPDTDDDEECDWNDMPEWIPTNVDCKLDCTLPTYCGDWIVQPLWADGELWTNDDELCELWTWPWQDPNCDEGGLNPICDRCNDTHVWNADQEICVPFVCDDVFTKVLDADWNEISSADRFDTITVQCDSNWTNLEIDYIHDWSLMSNYQTFNNNANVTSYTFVTLDELSYNTELVWCLIRWDKWDWSKTNPIFCTVPFLVSRCADWNVTWNEECDDWRYWSDQCFGQVWYWDDWPNGETCEYTYCGDWFLQEPNGKWLQDWEPWFIELCEVWSELDNCDVTTCNCAEGYEYQDNTWYINDWCFPIECDTTSLPFNPSYPYDNQYILCEPEAASEAEQPYDYVEECLWAPECWFTCNTDYSYRDLALQKCTLKQCDQSEIPEWWALCDADSSERPLVLVDGTPAIYIDNDCLTTDDEPCEFYCWKDWEYYDPDLNIDKCIPTCEPWAYYDPAFDMCIDSCWDWIDSSPDGLDWIAWTDDDETCEWSTRVWWEIQPLPDFNNCNPITCEPPIECPVPVDVIVVLDESWSIWSDYWILASSSADFMFNMMSHEDSNWWVVLFSTQVNSTSWLTTDYEPIYNGINSWWAWGWTNVVAWITTAAGMHATTPWDPDADNHIVIFTDWLFDIDDAAAAAANAWWATVHIILLWEDEIEPAPDVSSIPQNWWAEIIITSFDQIVNAFDSITWDCEPKNPDIEPLCDENTIPDELAWFELCEPTDPSEEDQPYAYTESCSDTWVECGYSCPPWTDPIDTDDDWEIDSCIEACTSEICLQVWWTSYIDEMTVLLPSGAEVNLSTQAWFNFPYCSGWDGCTYNVNDFVDDANARLGDNWYWGVVTPNWTTWLLDCRASQLWITWSSVSFQSLVMDINGVDNYQYFQHTWDSDICNDITLECPNWIREYPEQCDDGNTDNTDECTDACECWPWYVFDDVEQACVADISCGSLNWEEFVLFNPNDYIWQSWVLCGDVDWIVSPTQLSDFTAWTVLNYPLTPYASDYEMPITWQCSNGIDTKECWVTIMLNNECPA